MNVVQSGETREKIAAGVRRTKQRLKRERLAARAAQAAEAFTADLRPAFAAKPLNSDDEEEYTDSEEDENLEGLILDPIELEKAILEVQSLRNQLTSWMDAYERSKFVSW